MAIYDVLPVGEIRACRGEWLFTDGGIIGRNPSAEGGTWACAHVRDGELVADISGVLLPTHDGPLTTVTNNLTELYALCKGLAWLPEDWRGTIVLDSFVTLCRRFPGAKMNNIPDYLVPHVRRYMARKVDTCRWTLVDGHPTKDHLATGIGKRGGRVSEWNVHVDRLCNDVKKEWFEGRPVTVCRLGCKTETLTRDLIGIGA